MFSSCFCLPLVMYTLEKYNLIAFSCKMFSRNESWPRVCHAQSTSKLCLACSASCSTFLFFFPSRISCSFSECWSTCHPSSSTKIYLRLFHEQSATKEHYTVCTALHFSSWGVNNIKRASAGFNANTIIHSAQCESTSCPRWQRKYCQRSQHLAEKKHFRFWNKGYLSRRRSASAVAWDARFGQFRERRAQLCERSTIRGASLHQQSCTTERPQKATGSLKWSQTNGVWKTNVRASFQPERFPTSRSNFAAPPACHWDHVNMLLHLDSVWGKLLWSSLRHVFLYCHGPVSLNELGHGPFYLLLRAKKRW